MNVRPRETGAAFPANTPAPAAPVQLLDLFTATAPYSPSRARSSAEFQRLDRLTGFFSNDSIETRQSVGPIGWFEVAHDWADRSWVSCDVAGMLFKRAFPARFCPTPITRSCSRTSSSFL